MKATFYKYNLVYYWANRIELCVGLDQPDLSGNTDKKNCFDAKRI